MFTKIVSITALLFSVSTYAKDAAKEAPKTEVTRVFFISPKDGETVAKTFKAKFGQEGLTVSPAGQQVDNKKMGHFHIIVDDGVVKQNEVIGSDAKHLHFGKGQTEAELSLTPGPHKLTLLFADGAHRSGGEALSQTITVNVK